VSEGTQLISARAALEEGFTKLIPARAVLEEGFTKLIR